jgi:hypothetical protein
MVRTRLVHCQRATSVRWMMLEVLILVRTRPAG